MLRNRTLSIGFVILLAHIVSAEPGNTSERAKAVAPFVNEQTLVVGRINPGAMDMPGMEKWILELGRKFGPEIGAEKLMPLFHQGLVKVEKWSSDLKRAGISEIFMIIQTEGEVYPVYVIPIPTGADVQAMKAIISDGFEVMGEKPDRTVMEANDSLVFSSDKVIQEIKSLKASPRPEFEKALATTDPSTLMQLAVVPSDRTRKLLDSAGVLPDYLGGGPANRVTGPLQWVAVSFNYPPKPSLQVVVKANDAAGVQILQEVVAKVLKNLDDMLPTKALAMLTPKPSGDSLILSFNKEQFDSFVNELIAPRLAMANERHMRIKSGYNIRQMIQNCLIYESEHDKWPDTLEAAIAGAKGTKDVLVNPRQPTRNPGYVYLKPSQKPAANTVVIYEAYEKWPEVLVVGFGDGHVEFLEDEAAFKRMLKSANAGK